MSKQAEQKRIPKSLHTLRVSTLLAQLFSEMEEYSDCDHYELAEVAFNFLGYEGATDPDSLIDKTVVALARAEAKENEE